jgi:cytoskeleton protein RodZ
MEPIGERLKNTRLKKGLSLEEAHKKTKLHLKILKGLEEGDLINVSPVYVRGFLKIYCKFLGLNPADFIPGHNEPAKPLRSHAPAKKAPVKLAIGKKFLPFDFLKPYLSKRAFIYALACLGVIVLFFGLGKLLASRSQARKSAQSDYPLAAAKKKERPPASVKPKNSYDLPGSIQPHKAPEESLTRALTQGVRLVIRAREDCYINLRADGHTAFSRILRKGMSETWNAKDKIEFSLSNASAVSLEINGNPVPSLGKKKRALKNILINKNGLISIQ